MSRTGNALGGPGGETDVETGGADMTLHGEQTQLPVPAHLRDTALCLGERQAPGELHTRGDSSPFLPPEVASPRPRLKPGPTRDCAAW